MPDLRESFSQVWGREPFDYQVRVAESLLSGHNVVLRAPTGSGKTLAALHPFVHAHLEGKPWADRLLYALPLRTLAGSLYGEKEVRKGLGSVGLSITTQTGLNRGDPTFRGKVCFATIDQVLSGYVGQPVSVSGGQANVVGGALVGAYLVFDEFHLLEPEKALITVLDLADRLRDFASLLLMTATAPAGVVDWVADRLEAVVVEPSGEELGKMPALSTRRRHYALGRETLTPDVILERHLASDSHRTIAVFNTVERAQEAFDAVRKSGRVPADHKVLLLHSRFLPRDRTGKEALAGKGLSEKSSGKMLLIATQVVEVGLNISAERLLTELAPANSLVQRAGRCARFRNQEGVVEIFDVPASSGRRYAPYDEGLCEEARTWLSQALASGPLEAGYPWECSFVDETMSGVDLSAIESLLQTRRRDIAHSLTSDPSGAYRSFVRDVDAFPVTIHSAPGTIDLRRGIDTFSVAEGVLRGFLARLDWAERDMGRVLWPEWADSAADENGGPLVREWVAAPDPKAAMSAVARTNLLVLSPKVASYDGEMGLLLGREGTWETQPGDGESKKDWDDTGVAETFRRHSVEVARRVGGLVTREGRSGLARISAKLAVDSSLLLLLLVATGLLHDFGKLDRQWQEVIWILHTGAEAAGRGSPGPASLEDEEAFLAHSAHRAKDKRRRLPPHAVSGALAAFPVLTAVIKQSLPPGTAATTIGSFQVALAAAIARHHSALSKNSGGFDPAPGARAEVQALLDYCPASRPALASDVVLLGLRKTGPSDGQKWMNDITGCLSDRAARVTWALYWFAVRFVRLADQESQQALLASAMTEGRPVSGEVHKLEGEGVKE